ncbi:type II toxin-antitoxin system VapB family antitoxin [Rathayibacter soli]|uniref:type II toxin-antitoxin system VapB family antitoxin n=1 Tax=Rathayibacter soli TaxID=3144168 RepID=UPI0027E4B34A|nr:type II toxin-antitoxin system VapB family antitoxin [Glaciibacter superstes]
MALNIKDEAVHALVRELAALTGESQTRAVATAVQASLERLRSAPAESVGTRLLQIGRDCARHLDAATRTLDHGELLYDAEGLPR